MSNSLKEWVKEIHRNSVEHGWWDDPCCFGEVVALCHSELSEALEEDREGNAVVYCSGGKPEGVAVEMVDCMIRILDWFGYMEIDVEEVLEMKHNYNKDRPYKHGKKY